MDTTGAMRRRDALKAAGAGLAVTLLAATAKAQTTSDVRGGVAPVTAPFDRRLYAVWKGAGDDAGLWYASFDGAIWSTPMRIPRVASSAAPSLAVFGNKLYAAWKGANADQRLWYASFDGAEWSAQAQIPGAASGNGPALSVFAGKLYAVWTASVTGAGLCSASFDGAKWSNDAKASSAHPFSPADIANSGLGGAGGIDQGKHNDCVFEASLAAVAMTARGQAAIARMIVQNSDGSYVVTFPGAPENHISITQADMSAIRVSDRAAWAKILEAALIKWDPHFANGAKLPPNPKGAADGRSPTPAQYALHLLTGSLASKDVAASASIGEKIAHALGNGQPVVAFCANNDDGALVSGHEWTVMACDARANRITLRNPWGKFRAAGETKGGITYEGNAEVSMTLQQFGRFYREVTFGYHRV